MSPETPPKSVSSALALPSMHDPHLAPAPRPESAMPGSNTSAAGPALSGPLPPSSVELHRSSPHDGHVQGPCTRWAVRVTSPTEPARCQASVAPQTSQVCSLFQHDMHAQQVRQLPPAANLCRPALGMTAGSLRALSGQDQSAAGVHQPGLQVVPHAVRPLLTCSRRGPPRLSVFSVQSGAAPDAEGAAACHCRQGKQGFLRLVAC